MDTLRFYVSQEQLVNTPSRQDGVSEEDETSLRIFGCELIEYAGILLRLPQVTMCTAQVLFHRFYYRASMMKHDVRSVAIAALFLSTKISETPKKLRDVCNVYFRLLLRNEGKPIRPLDIAAEEYWEMKDEILTEEKYILKELGFILHVEHPQKYIINFLKVLEGDNEFIQTSWNYANDSYRTNVCVIHTPEAIAVACIFMAGRVLGIPLPEEPRPWWELFGVELKDIANICEAVLSLYSRPKARFVDLHSPTQVEDQKVGTNTILTHISNTNGNDKEMSRKRSRSPSASESTGGSRQSPKERKDRERSYEKERRDRKDRDRDRDRDREKKDKDRDRSRDRDRERDRERDRDRDRSHSRRDSKRSSRDRK